MHRAHAKYNDRTSEEGLEVHRLEEAGRRARRAADFVGDHRCPEELGQLRVPPSTGAHAVAETINAAAPARPVTPLVEALEAEPALFNPDDEVREAPGAPLEWVLVAWPEVLAVASRRQGTEARCPYCGRRGRIVEVTSIERWRRRSRRWFDQEA